MAPCERAGDHEVLRRLVVEEAFNTNGRRTPQEIAFDHSMHYRLFTVRSST